MSHRWLWMFGQLQEGTKGHLERARVSRHTKPNPTQKRFSTYYTCISMASFLSFLSYLLEWLQLDSMVSSPGMAASGRRNTCFANGTGCHTASCQRSPSSLQSLCCWLGLSQRRWEKEQRRPQGLNNKKPRTLLFNNRLRPRLMISQWLSTRICSDSAKSAGFARSK